MSVIFENLSNNSQMVYTKGAVKRIIDTCERFVWINGKEVDMVYGIRKEILDDMKLLLVLVFVSLR